MNFKKFIAVMLALLVCVGLVGCKKDNGAQTYSISYDLDGGTLSNAPTS